MTPTHRDEETMTDLARVTALCGAPFLSTREIQELRQIALDMSAELRRHRSASSPQETGWRGMEPTTRDLCIAFEAGWPDTTLIDDKQLTGLRRAIKAYLAVVEPLPEPHKP